ncbi:MAG: MerR family transcriptional regulator [Lachnospiraceae bacterium]|nr:MerR family transcriptional regulator [Lachnospiraceae bacterium]
MAGISAYINEAAKLSGTTKKAIEYYCQKVLLNPAWSDKGYRLFSDEDVEELKKISLLRSLDTSVENIQDARLSQ